MNSKTLLIGAAAALVCAGAAEAKAHHMSSATAGRYAGPSQPIAYSMLNSYLKTSPHQRASRDWSGGVATAAAASGSAAVNTSATTPAAPPASNPPAAGAPVNPPASNSMAPSSVGANPSTSEPGAPAAPSTPSTTSP